MITLINSSKRAEGHLLYFFAFIPFAHNIIFCIILKIYTSNRVWKLQIKNLVILDRTKEAVYRRDTNIIKFVQVAIYVHI